MITMYEVDVEYCRNFRELTEIDNGMRAGGRKRENFTNFRMKFFVRNDTEFKAMRNHNS